MSKNKYLLLHKTEWARMKTQGDTRNYERPNTNKEDYIKSLHEQSQNWIKNWPDTVQGHISQLEKQNKAEKLKLIESVKEYISKDKYKKRNMECIKKAKELIFDDSSYGRQLLSALLASKTLEERDVQIKFQNNIKHEENVLRNNEPKSSSLQNANEMEINEKKIKEYQKQNAFEMAHANKTMLDLQKKKKLLEKKQAKQDQKYEGMSELLIEEEKKIMTENIILHRESVKEYEGINKKIKELKALTEKEDERKRTIWLNYQERVNYKNQIIFDQMYKNKASLLQYRKVYENIKNLNEEKNKMYNGFVDKGIELLQERLKLKEEKKKNKTPQCKIRKLLDEKNKILAKVNNTMSSKNKVICECRRQTLIDKESFKTKRKNDTSGPLFLKVENVSSKNLTKPEKKSTKNSLQNSHAYFAERATDTLQQCRYKNMALKVLHNYRKENRLDATSLPVADF